MGKIKKCSVCKESKELDEFPKDKGRTDGRHPYCKVCVNIVAHRISIEDYRLIIKKQKNRCAICLGVLVRTEKDKSNISIDHDHECCPGTRSCGKCVRGILCRSCNLMIGNAKEEPYTLIRGAEYLRSYK